MVQETKAERTPSRVGLVLGGVVAVLVLDVIVTLMATPKGSNLEEVKNARAVVDGSGRVLSELLSKSGDEWGVVRTEGKVVVLEARDAERRFQECVDGQRRADSSMRAMTGMKSAGMTALFKGQCPQFLPRSAVIKANDEARRVLAEDSGNQLLRVSMAVLGALLALATVLVARRPTSTNADGSQKAWMRTEFGLAVLGFASAIVPSAATTFIPAVNRYLPNDRRPEVWILFATSVLLAAFGLRHLLFALALRKSSSEGSASPGIGGGNG